MAELIAPPLLTRRCLYCIGIITRDHVPAGISSSPQERRRLRRWGVHQLYIYIARH